MSDSDVTLGFPTHRNAYERAQVGCRFRPQCVLPRQGDVPRAAGPAGHRAPAGGTGRARRASGLRKPWDPPGPSPPGGRSLKFAAKNVKR